ncbi:Putative multidrug resistance protein precursor [Sorangium cellulosum So ce56]|uniref:Multidrug resistance protein n=1 Tax=Sorangium cellulosum (strain So ce56) TaxID=448385 RepID=A9FWU2_SORC5|nr:efflux RND transporter periplasmic adaptor subunit [Sorangium cellulosum]CAN95448.1 Putative multidrug resistance protein precursor [Sorangium cellulosum So ce56]
MVLQPIRVAALALVAALVFLGSPACKKGGEASPEQGRKPAKQGLSFPVEVVPVAAERVEYAVPAVGAVEAFEQVQLTARVAGVVEAVRFMEGAEVKAGQVLVEIDPARYNLAVRAARATLDRVTATQAEAAAGLERREAEGADGVFSKEDVASWRSRAATTAAQVAEAKVAVDQALLNLRDAYVRAPIQGKIQTRTVQTGQHVPVGTVLATLLRRDPLLLRFQIPAADAPRVRPDMEARFTVKGDARTYSARLTHVADAADPATRMVAVTGEVQGEGKELLRPGTFAEVTVPVGASGDAPVIPLTSVRPSERGFLAYVVDGTTARERVLSLGLRTPDGRVEVKSGLSVGELLVARGAEALREGAQVRIAAPGSVPGGQAAGRHPEGGADASASAAGASPPAASSGASPPAASSGASPLTAPASSSRSVP